MKSRSSGGLVYSTDVGRTCPVCRCGVALCRCKKNQTPALPAGKIASAVRVTLSTKGRGGKSVTVIKNVPLGAAELALLGKQLRSACGSGGTTKDGVIEVQGDHCSSVVTALEKLQFTVKLVSG